MTRGIPRQREPTGNETVNSQDSGNEQEDFFLTVNYVLELKLPQLFETGNFPIDFLEIEKKLVLTKAIGNYSGTVDTSIDINQNPNNNPVYQDLFLSTGNNAAWVEDIEESNQIEGLNFDELTGQGYNAEEGTVFQFKIELETSAELSFDWKFFTNEDHNEYGGTKDNYNFNDFAFVAIDSDVNVFTSYRKADLVEAQDSDYVYSTADFQTYSKSLGAGIHTIAIGIFDGGDWVVDSGLEVLNVELILL